MDIIILKKKSFTVTPVSMEPVCKSNEICTGSVCWEVQNIDKIIEECPRLRTQPITYYYVNLHGLELKTAVQICLI